MSENLPKLKIIARIRTDFPDKFGIPRQSGILEGLESKIVFEAEYSDPNAIRGIEEWSHLWLIWLFSEAIREKWSPTVRPPRLGGNKRVGVFSTRSPFRPNPIGLSCVQLKRTASEDGRIVLYVTGADLMDGTPILDIKPYLPFSDCHPEALGGFAERVFDYSVEVEFPPDMLDKLPEQKRNAAIEILRQDPRPAVQADRDKIFALLFAGFEIKFTVSENLLKVISTEKIQ